MPEVLSPAYVYLIGAILLPLLPQGFLRCTGLLLVPLLGVWQLSELGVGVHSTGTIFGVGLTFIEIDGLSYIFALVFSLAAFLALLYAWHVRDTVQQVATLLYAGSAIGAVLAGDLITLFFWWEGTAIASVFLIWARRTRGAYATGMRYLVIQIASGVLLIAGVALRYQQTGSVEFEQMQLQDTATLLIFLAFGIKCAFPLLHNWLQDSYPAATITGTVVLSAFTTKLAVYALARGFPGTEMLLWIGAIMALFPIFYAIIEDDLRRVLAYSLNNQLGYMVVGIGVGTPMALNGTAAHAFAHILYKGLLFMSIGAVLYRTGTSKASQLGGLYRTMPYTMLFCIVGAMSISAFPLFSGFVTKSLITSGAGKLEYELVWLALLVSSAGVLAKTGIKLPYYAFFHRDSGLRPKEAPWNMLLAMGITAALCVAIGVYPAPLYALLPYDAPVYEPYTVSHVVAQLQVLLFSALLIAFLMRRGMYPAAVPGINLDFDWVYRRMLPSLLDPAVRTWRHGRARIDAFTAQRVEGLIDQIYATHGPLTRLARTWPAGSMVLWVAILLGATLIVNYL